MIALLALLQTPAMLLGIIGAVLTVSHTRTHRKAGYCSWVIGNTLWFISGIFTGNINLIIQFGFFALLAVQGISINRESRKNMDPPHCGIVNLT
ncbi:hypothetical protein F1737_08960 [Methanoplanus sp. FWC-SCC4]|uniref:YgjV family protein n=1 Tax=Methanochimaera problematica TaxID=2609417 RepID=A0AA97FD79_9EURY|nr:hypothetical protein [Methanoplanus sp. FWC-SCC4]WOF16809.1 hypothetical protein F1737_08960 [Methanoplanus sp. FWC-SCC4]